MATFTLPIIDEFGINIPTYETVREEKRAAFREIFGQDIYIEPDSQDGQWLDIEALALHDAYSFAAAVYNAFSPSTAQGVGLSRVVKINGITRHMASFSFVDLRIVGQAGATIVGGAARDDAGNTWTIEDDVVIPPAGEIIVSAVCDTVGAVSAPPGTITTIATPTRGWQSVENVNEAIMGDLVETDAALRARQTVSTMIPSQTIFEGILGAIAQVAVVTRYAGRENDTDIMDEESVPPHTLAFVVEGGEVDDIADTIARKKSPGVGLVGTTSVTVFDAYGIPRVINFFRPTNVPIRVEITLVSLNNYSAAVEDAIRLAVADWLSSLAIGEDVIHSRVYVPANLDGDAMSKSYRITNLRIARDAAPFGTADIPLTFTEAAVGDVADVDLIVS